MLQLINELIEAHGGLERWSRVEKVSATFQPNGLALTMRGQEAFSRQPTRVTVDTRDQRVSIDPFLEPGHVGLYQPDRTAIVTTDGRIVEELKEPRESFKPDSPWSGPQLVYFAGHALWTYFNLPFRLVQGDIHLEEVAPWTEDGETWRAVKVSFPKSIATLSSEQVLYFDDRGLLRREDYAVEVTQRGPVAHYVDGHQTFDGIVFPTQRRIYPRGPDGAPNKEVVIIAADLSDFKLVEASSI
ncbi:hypothetical protein PY650_34890 [Rhizobium calliandrae]|uniref:Uncharacterized protein n=1 Tax=Rhizobium calliandrae TaxID=1312182 RepID=A0ABT7KPW2_9HYPH|nr:hypothetical protein [Rhizobium calliandrae]MDL2410667.1 hypothetical protein [Rhizobium calliandrae]